MALSRKGKLRRVRSRAEAVERTVPPTPQTRARLRCDVVAGLLAKRRLAPRHLEAAVEIRAVLEAVGRGMFPSSAIGDATVAGRSRKAARDFLERMTAAERRIWQRRYLPWTRAMALSIAAGLPGVRWLQLVLDVVIDNASLRTVERRYRLRNGAALDYLREGLERYGG